MPFPFPLSLAGFDSPHAFFCFFLIGPGDVTRRAAADVVQSGTASVAVNCLSGRGRTGTFSAIALGQLLKVQSNADLADVVVGMRENRDGLIETPEQLRFAARVLGLPDTADCNPLCDAQVRLWSAWKCPRHPCIDSLPGTPTLPRHATRRCGPPVEPLV